MPPWALPPLSPFSLLGRSRPTRDGHSQVGTRSLLKFRPLVLTAWRIFLPKWTQYVTQRWIHYLTFKTIFSSCFSFLFFVTWPYHCFKPGSHPSVFPLSITPNAPNLISHKIHHVNFLSVFLKDPLLHITWPHFFLPRSSQGSPQLPTNLFSILARVMSLQKTKIHWNALLLSVPFTPKTQTRCINQAYSALLQIFHHGPPKCFLSKLLKVLPKVILLHTQFHDLQMQLSPY